MRLPLGYATWTDPERPLVERDTTRCGHCGCVIFVKPGHGATVYLVQHRDGRWTEQPGAGCRVCMAAVCLACYHDGRCLPLERSLEQAERRIDGPGLVRSTT